MKRGETIWKVDFGSVLLLVLLVAAVWLAYEMVRPFLDALILAGLATVIMNPLYAKLLRLLGGRKSVAAILVTLLLFVLVVIPGWFLLRELLREAVTTFQSVMQWLDSEAFQAFMKKPVIVRIFTVANRYLGDFRALAGVTTGENVQVNQILVQTLTYIAKQALDQGSYAMEHALSFLGNFLLMVFVFFFLIRDQSHVRAAVFRLLPFTWGYEKEIDEQMTSITRSTILGIFLTAVAQAIGAGFAFWICGMPVLVGSMATLFASFIPLVGTGVVWLPAMLYLLFTNHTGLAVFLTIWWAVVVGFLLDNVLRSVLVSGRERMSTPLVFVSIIGGIYFFGLLGVIYGPLFLGFLRLLFYLYEINLTRKIEPSEDGNVLKP